ncbi:PHP domain-containing protein [Nocardioides mesophilus]|uniref:PHP domain-containing protein n=1 Tax=Nocardioides mesophilus TaxID=433659 RepID=A0A7G9R830_9ACTN|nr:PHP domain-containing protein [Nocardioides mesophilus]QNN51755.1 PHP domain-containing protein [Nocardioides mesophilus]
MRIDLHTHSNRSDGTDPPAELVRRARAEGLDVLALTDHDTTHGWAEAAAAAEELGIRLVRGIEISTRYAGSGVHLLAYLPDPDHPELIAQLDRVLDGRNGRLPAILERLARVDIDLDEDDVRRLAGNAAALGRPHVADALVAKGVVASRDEAFARFLGPGGPAYVNRYAPDVRAMIAHVTAAGGVSVLAHPWAGRHEHSALDRAGLAELKEAGLAGIEVDHQDHDALTRQRLRDLAWDLDLVRTGSSDYHGTGKVDHELGCNTTDPGQFERLLELAAAAASRVSGSTPDVVGQ